MARRLNWTKARKDRPDTGFKVKAAQPGRKAQTAIGAYDNYLARKRRLREQGDAAIARSSNSP